MQEKTPEKEYDLDIVISNLLNGTKRCTVKTIDDVTSKADDLIDKSIEMKTLPISLRKRVLYNLALKTQI